ncbi:hypothetical protein TKK_0010001 [Trichogramma kaykai]
MISLPTQKPELYDEFVKGNFTVKRSPANFTSVGTDQALEQTINRSQKSSLDTDVLVLISYYWITFKTNNLLKLWIEHGSGAKTRVVAVYQIAENYGNEFYSVLPALHHLTGADYTSKIGTKYSAIRADPITYLKTFAHDISEAKIEESLDNAEQFLLRVLRKKHLSFDFLRKKMHFAFVLPTELPATSASIRLHARRAFYATYMQINLLNPSSAKLDPTLFGFCLENEHLIPSKIENLFPSNDALVPSCTCEVCSTKSCGCHRNQLACTSFCKCHINNTCKNPFDKKN